MVLIQQNPIGPDMGSQDPGATDPLGVKQNAPAVPKGVRRKGSTRRTGWRISALDRRSRLFRSHRAENGATLVETALVMPLFLCVLFGIIFFTLLLVAYINACYAANVGARFASVHSLTSLQPSTTTDDANVTLANLIFMPSTSSRIPLVYYGNRSGVPGNYVGDDVGVAVVVFYQKLNIPFWGSQTFELQAQAYRFITR